MDVPAISVADAATVDHLRREAIRVDWEVAFGGKSAGNHHLERVARLTDFLLEAAWAAGERPDSFVTLAGAAIHDVGLILGNRDHARNGAIVCEALLRFLGIEEPRRSAIVACVRSHDFGTDEAASDPVPPPTIEARIVHDADTLDKLGPLGAIRHTWKLSVDPERAWTAGELLDFLPGHLAERASHLHLEAARRLAGRYGEILARFVADRAGAMAVLEAIMGGARLGRPTEAIVAELGQTFPGSAFVGAAAEQLELKYLDTTN
jgi:HD superfamily phosphodiesterase